MTPNTKSNYDDDMNMSEAERSVMAEIDSLEDILEDDTDFYEEYDYDEDDYDDDDDDEYEY